MDEQQMSQHSDYSSYDVSADGGAYSGYEEEPSTPTTPEPTPEPEQPAQEEELAPDGVRLNEDGELEVGSEFFGDIADETAESPKPQPEAPKQYSDDELSNTPFEQWDKSRLPEPIRKYYDAVARQLQSRQVQQRVQSQPYPSNVPEPKQYSPQELSEAAVKLACEKLGIQDAEDFDDYERSHRAAYEMATRELIERRNQEIAQYQSNVSSWDTNQRFQAELVRQPDFAEFDQWFMEQCRKSGTTPQAVNEGFMRRVQANGGNYSIIPQTIGRWYQEFRQEKGASKVQPKPRAARPVVLESSQGNNSYGTGKRLNASDFGGMTPDEQAEALIKIGAV